MIRRVLESHKCLRHYAICNEQFGLRTLSKTS
jgi:hypothetical protein